MLADRYLLMINFSSVSREGSRARSETVLCLKSILC